MYMIAFIFRYNCENLYCVNRKTFMFVLGTQLNDTYIHVSTVYQIYVYEVPKYNVAEHFRIRLIIGY